MHNKERTPNTITPNLPLWSFQLQQDSKLAVKTRKDLEIYLITRALKDEGFRQELVANPKAVVEKELGTKLPEDLEIKVLEETEDTLYMVLPCNPYEGLSEEELKASLGMSYEDVAQWTLEQHRNTLLDEDSSVKLLTHVWQNDIFKNQLFSNSKMVIEKELEMVIPSAIEIRIFEETSENIFLLLPKVLEKLEDLQNSGVELVIGQDLCIPITGGLGSGYKPSASIGVCLTGVDKPGCPNPPLKP